MWLQTTNTQDARDYEMKMNQYSICSFGTTLCKIGIHPTLLKLDTSVSSCWPFFEHTSSNFPLMSL
jgi:hypothetical protein